MIKSLEGGRGLAALIVAMYHLAIGKEYFSVIRNGYIFVDLFFVLSGFVISAAYLNRLHSNDDLRSFVIRRFGRLFPLLIFSTLFYLLMANMIVFAKKLAAAHGYAALLHNPGALEYLLPTAGELLATVTMTHGMGLFDDLILNTPSWSISTEFYTYLLFAGLCLLLPKKARIPGFALLVIAGFLISIWASVTVHNCLEQKGCMSLTYDFGYIRTVHAFFLGALTYLVSKRIRSGFHWWQAGAFLAMLLLFAFVDAVPALGFAFPLTFAALILSVHADRGWLARILQWRPFQILGERSYSVYLLHMPLVLFFENLAKRVDGPLAAGLVLVVYLGAVITLSGWTYRFIEDPFRARFNRLAAGPEMSVKPASW